ncbi:MAG: bifunctional 2-C-methyl-D-erythritol 4-phosphate cytidylyltransferase/2-C-methyl-D-erythritol 2,4-cyclodiphosphate synthase [Pseudomonadota bacterium]
MRNAAIIVAAGLGRRAGDGAQPKQLRPLGDKPVFQWSIEAFRAHSRISEIVLVVPSGMQNMFSNWNLPEIRIVEGGETRSESVLNGLNTLRANPPNTVLIHDAARPGLDQATISELIAALQHADAAAPALPVADALKRWKHNRASTLDRQDLYRVQTPQAFQFEAIHTALSAKTGLVDDLAAIEAQNGTVKLIEGREALGKITFPEDHVRMERLLMPPLAAPRFGTGFDVHSLEPGDHVTLCGVAIPHTQQLVGHSDADVAWHALTDAILGAAALGDIGDHFPPSDPQWKGVDSAVFLKHAVEIARAAGWALSSCDLTIICEAPKIKPHRDAMRASTAQITGLPVTAIGLKATTTEGLGFTGRGEGIAAQASAVLSALPPQNEE